MIEKIVVARNNKYGIGYKGDIPWFIKEDLLHFKEQTINQIVVMGKDTYLGMCSKFNKGVGSVVLSNRFNIVISKTLKEEGFNNKPGIAFFNSIPEFRRYIKTEAIKAKLYKSGISEIIYMGGEGIYSEALQYATELVLTEVETSHEVDRFFVFDKSKWKLRSVKPIETISGINCSVISYTTNNV